MTETKEKKRHRNWRPFEEAREYARSLGLKNSLEWIAFWKSGKKPKDIPYQSFIVYKGKGWISYGNWLGAAPSVTT